MASKSESAISGFVLAEKLGSGTYATVYKAYLKSSRREVVAIKCVEKSTLSSTAVENLLTEISLLKRLKHEYVVEMKDFLWDDKFIYVIMEYCSGGDLSSFIRARRTLSERVAKCFLQQLALALKFLRTNNVSHMDLKPQNILLSSKENPVLKLADFGLAQYLDAHEDASSLRGSPLYMAPEILLKHKYDARVDLWSVGVILYECLFGRAPYSSRSFSELLQKVISGKAIQIPYGVQICNECRDLINRLLQRNPDERISFEEFFNHPFVDLEHMPSKESYDKAVTLVVEAVGKDQVGEYADAVRLYCQALQYFVPAIQYESNLERKEAMREKAREYVNRAEILKELLRPKYSAVDSPVVELLKLSSDNPPLHAAIKMIRSAESLEKDGNFSSALAQYQNALDNLLPLLAAEPKATYRRELLHTEIQKWLKKAEEIKHFLNVSEITTEEPHVQIDNVADISVADSVRQQCCIQ